MTKKASGPGGQHVNKTESCVVIRHLPTGIEAQSATRSQHDNKRLAREVLEARVAAYLSDRSKADRDASRRQMVGSGMRGDKIRTYRQQDDSVSDHRSGRKARFSQILAGKLEVLFE